MELNKNTRSFSNRIVRFSEAAALICVAICAALLCYLSMTETYYLDPQCYYNAIPLAIQRVNNVPFTVAVVSVVLAAIAIIFRFVNVTVRFVRRAGLICLFVVFALGIAWTLFTRADPISDQGVLYQTALSIVNGAFDELRDTSGYSFFYFFRYPFQFGYLLYVETFLRVFGESGALIAIRIVNAAWIVSGYYAIVLTSEMLFESPRTSLLTLLLLCTLTQPVFACTYVYGLIPSCAVMLWLFYCIVRYVRTGKKRLLPLIVSLGVACLLLKPNGAISLVAGAIILILYALVSRRRAAIIAAVLLVVLPFVAQRGVQLGYEGRIGVSYGKGLPISVHIAMSMREGPYADGWYSTYTHDVKQIYGLDRDAYSAQSQADIRESIKKMTEDRAYARGFFHEKMSSQWNEPTFQSIWVSAVCIHEHDLPKNVVAEWIEQESMVGGLIDKAMGYQLRLLYAAFLVSLLFLFRRDDPALLLYPVCILGGVLYHLLSEANSHYALTYLPLFVPYAAFGVIRLGASGEKLICSIKRRKKVPEHGNKA